MPRDFSPSAKRTVDLGPIAPKRNSGPSSVLLAIEDVTARRAAERMSETRASALVQEHQRKDEFLAMLGHELRNPLSAMVHGLDLLGLTFDDSARLDQIRQMMARQAGRIGSMLDQLLDVGRLTGGKIQLSSAPVDLVEAAQAAIEAVTPLIERSKHELSTRMPPAGELRVRGDLMRLTQVVENLLSNAAKYTEEGGKIELSLESTKERAIIRVRDTGIGMDAELIPHIFELFTQAPRTLERSAGGMGLGLPLVERVVEMHGGSVEARSPGRGKGSEFIVTLPRLIERRSSEGADGAGARRNGRGHSRILVVDDEKDSADALAELLQVHGHTCRAVYDGPAALKAAAAFRPQVVLLDLGLPQMDGYEVAKQLREDHPGEEILMVALTGYQKDAERLDRAGFNRHLIKPPNMKKLLRWVATWERESN